VEVPTIPPPMTTMFLGVVTVMRSERALVCLERYGAKDTEIGEQIDFSELGGQLLPCVGVPGFMALAA